MDVHSPTEVTPINIPRDNTKFVIVYYHENIDGTILAAQDYPLRPARKISPKAK